MQLLGVTLSSLSPSEIVASIGRYLNEYSFHHIVTVNPEYIVDAQTDSEFMSALNNSDIQTIDGVGIPVALAYLSKRQGAKDSLVVGLLKFLKAYIDVIFSSTTSATRLSGVDLMWLIILQEYMRGRKVYLLGGRQNIAALAAKRLSQFADSITFRTSNGLTSKSKPDLKEASRILDDIRSFAPDVLFVAYGHPFQDIWIARNKDSLNCKIAVGVGGSFDFIGGKVTRAPIWVRKIGCEWVYRLMKEPTRIKRIFKATFVFMRLVIQSPL